MTGTEIVALVAWYAFIAACIMAFYLLADAATLSMTGSCTGQGFSNITIEADILMASINQTANGTTWQIWGAPA
ncbi:MAG: hypothetical protein ACOX7O_11640 [Oscillospiraceae bacterium]|jgi:hypothetical protein